MSDLIQIKRGLLDDLPRLKEGELGYCTDTNELYIGTRVGNALIGGGSGGTGLTETIKILDTYETEHKFSYVSGSLAAYTATVPPLRIQAAFVAGIQKTSLTVVLMTNKVALPTLKYRKDGVTEWTDYTPTLLPTTNAVFCIEDLLESTKYEMRVMAAIEYPSESVTMDLIASTMSSGSAAPLPPVLMLASDITNKGFTINWFEVSGADSYEIDVNTTEEFDGTVIYDSEPAAAEGDTFLVITGLDPATSYYYRARAINSSGASESSSVGTTVTACDAPVATAATFIGGAQFTANWDATAGASEYELDVSTNSEFIDGSYVYGYEHKNITGTNIAVLGLTQETQYHYRLRAKNIEGTLSQYSNIISPETGVLLEIQSINFPIRQPSWVQVEWLTNKPASAKLEYKVSTDTEYTEFCSIEEEGTEHSILLTGLAMLETYSIRITAFYRNPTEEAVGIGGVSTTDTCDIESICAISAINSDNVLNNRRVAASYVSPNIATEAIEGNSVESGDNITSIASQILSDKKTADSVSILDGITTVIETTLINP